MNIKSAILSVLKSCGDYALTKGTLKTEVQIRVGGQIGDGEFSDALVFVKGKGWIDTRVDEMTEDTRYYITERGKTKANQ